MISTKRERFTTTSSFNSKNEQSKQICETILHLKICEAVPEVVLGFRRKDSQAVKKNHPYLHLKKHHPLLKRRKIMRKPREYKQLSKRI
jgi:hypothetical protein